jgi:hypothetical protein
MTLQWPPAVYVQLMCTPTATEEKSPTNYLENGIVTVESTFSTLNPPNTHFTYLLLSDASAIKVVEQ